MLLPHKVNDFAQLLCASGETRNLQGDDAVALLSRGKHQALLFLDFAVSVFVFQEYLFRSCRFQFAHLAVDILFALIGGATRIAVNHTFIPFSAPRAFCVPLERIFY